MLIFYGIILQNPATASLYNYSIYVLINTSSNITSCTNVHVWPPYHELATEVDVGEGITSVLVDCMATLVVGIIVDVAVETIHVRKYSSGFLYLRFHTRK